MTIIIKQSGAAALGGARFVHTVGRNKKQDKLKGFDLLHFISHK